jgi:hypothetical protein
VSAAASSAARPDGSGAIWNREAETMSREARERLQL